MKVWTLQKKKAKNWKWNLNFQASVFLHLNLNFKICAEKSIANGISSKQKLRPVFLASARWRQMFCNRILFCKSGERPSSGALADAVPGARPASAAVPGAPDQDTRPHSWEEKAECNSHLFFSFLLFHMYI